MNAKELFEHYIQGRNAFTPRVIAWYKVPNGAIELSTNSSNQRKGLTESRFMEDVYGVTIVGFVNAKSQLFDSKDEAMDFIMSLKPFEKVYYRRYNVYGDTKLMVTEL